MTDAQVNTSTPNNDISRDGPVTHDQAVLIATQLVHSSPDDQEKSLMIAEALKLDSCSITDGQGVKQYVLSHPVIIKRLAERQDVTVVSRSTKKTKLEDSGCHICSPSPAPGLVNLLAVSPYAKVLHTRTFVEVDESVCQLVNRDWTDTPATLRVC